MKSLTLLTLILLFMAMPAESQESGQIRVSGLVTDGETGEVLPGASILVEGTAKGTVTGLNGEYTIVVPAEGTVLVFAYLGYVEQRLDVGNQRTINVQLVPDVESLEEVVVTTQARGQIGARQQQINSNTIKNVVSPERLQENPDANAVEAIGRLPGDGA